MPQEPVIELEAEQTRWKLKITRLEARMAVGHCVSLRKTTVYRHL